jgi:multidrug transporter EmrE-like cation transporter
MWFRLMMVAFLFNGLCTFGIRILAAMGLAAKYTTSYLAFWYLAGTLFLAIQYGRTGERPKRSDLAVGSALGLCSAGGQTALGLALARGLPGSIVFPVVLAGGLFIVVASGVLIFGEKIGNAGRLGILLGIISIVLLSLD